MKKIIVAFCIFMAAFTMFGCSKDIKIEDSFSEITHIYFSAESGGLYGSICVGEREENYIIDGKHTKNCDFSLLSLKFKEYQSLKVIDISLKVNDKTLPLQLELNPINNSYMADLGYALNEGDEISLLYENYILNFSNISKSFGVDSSEAVKIALEQFGDDLDCFYRKGNFMGECYLKVLSQQDEENRELFWIVTIVGENKVTKNIIINIKSGEVLIKN